MLPNGGFPPIKLCKDKKDKLKKTNERGFSSNINVKQIFNIEKKNVVIEKEDNEEIVEV